MSELIDLPLIEGVNFEPFRREHLRPIWWVSDCVQWQYENCIKLWSYKNVHLRNYLHTLTNTYAFTPQMRTISLLLTSTQIIYYTDINDWFPQNNKNNIITNVSLISVTFYLSWLIVPNSQNEHISQYIVGQQITNISSYVMYI